MMPCQDLTDTVSANVPCGAIDAAQLLPAFPPALIDTLSPESQQQKKSIPCKTLFHY